ncbi:MAG: IreB family regulatory phosphoprotein [Desulfotomaculum sp.]|nr:IreB family regulatory phosphoprotein [Desulfotomaculum sp.]MCL0077883.1 IreB family regulatory phosphoprotein [Peptococcaceae bacterium]MCL0106195.1 IreB family regulatory phosphoprotein [Peptococcaceae bacterium]
MKNDFSENTVMFKFEHDSNKARDILKEVCIALKEKGYNPVNQLVGYFLSGDPAYITSHKNARNIIKRMERDELLEELIKHYLDTQQINLNGGK